MDLTPGKKVYFASDFHLGAPNPEESSKREKAIVRWLDEITSDVKVLFLVGDVFDFWFEYKQAVPRGHVRLLGKLAELSDRGVEIHWFTGNHDMWIFDYLPKEIGFQLHREPKEFNFNGKQFFIGHGDGLGPGDKGYKFIKKVFANKLCQWLFARLHPNFGIWLADYFSRGSRASTGSYDEQYLGKDQEWLYQFCERKIDEGDTSDYFIFGHRHLPLDLELSNASRYINLGEWIKYNSYAVFDGTALQYKYFEKEEFEGSERR
jgi:UDP-2,3-diacylglucosamine hydrolase